jgi:hypothetical protein
VERCLQKAAEQRFRSAVDVAAALERADDPNAPQAAYVVADPSARDHGLLCRHRDTRMAIREWVKTPTTVSLFIALGVGAAIGGVLRGHLVFTEHINRRNPAASAAAPLRH